MPLHRQSGFQLLRYIRTVLGLFPALLLLGNPGAQGAAKVVTSIPDLAWAAQQIGGEHVEARSLLKGTENPHYADAVPEFIRLVANADVVCFVGLELEVGWLPKVLARSGNAQIQQGGKGFCETGKSVATLEKRTGAVDRSMGDVHPEGNPHYWLDPLAFANASAVISEALIRVDAKNEDHYRKNYAALKAKLEGIHKKNRAKLGAVLSKIKGPLLIEYHGEFTYFNHAYGIQSFGTIEEKPGIPPSAGRIAEAGTSAKGAGVRIALVAEYHPHKVLGRFSELSGIPVVSVPTSIQPLGKIKDYAEFQDYLVDSILKALKQ